MLAPRAFVLLGALAFAACSDDSGSGGAGAGAADSGGGPAAGGSHAGGGGASSAGGGGAGPGGAGGATDPGPDVDTSDPQLYETMFAADQADQDASIALGQQPAYLDTRVPPLGLLVVYLHGAGAPSTCGSPEHEKVLAGMGFHVFGPCYSSDYGVGNCGDDIEGCRLEAFEGVDHHSFIDIAPPDSIETRIVKGLAYLQEHNPEGDWTYFLEGESPRWEKIVVSGISHGASSSGVIGHVRSAHRVVMLSGPYDVGQAWLTKPSITAADRFYGFSHTADDQHEGHLAAFESMGLSGEPMSIDGASPPYGGSHRLVTSAATGDGHSSTQAGGASPKDGTGQYVFLPAWREMYLDDP